MVIAIIGIFYRSSVNQINLDQVIFKRECKSFERKENEPEYGRQGEDFADLNVARDLALCRECRTNVRKLKSFGGILLISQLILLNPKPFILISSRQY